MVFLSSSAEASIYLFLLCNMISHQSHGEGPISLVILSFFNYMRVKWLVVIVLALGLLLWLWIDFMVLGPGRCFWQRNSTYPSRRVECNTDSRLFHCDRGRRLAGCRFVPSSKDIFLHVVCCDICKPPSTHCAFHSGRRCARNMSR